MRYCTITILALNVLSTSNLLANDSDALRTTQKRIILDLKSHQGTNLDWHKRWDIIRLCAANIVEIKNTKQTRSDANVNLWEIRTSEVGSIASGLNLPSEDELYTAVRQIFPIMPWERRSRYASQYPENGDICLEAFAEAVQAVNFCTNITDSKSVLNLEQNNIIREAWSNLEIQFESLMRVPNWWDQSDISGIMSGFKPTRSSISAEFNRMIKKGLDVLQEKIIDDPGNNVLWHQWASFARIAPPDPIQDLLSRIVPYPGLKWPDMDLLLPTVSAYRQWDMYESLAELADFGMNDLRTPPDGFTPETWKEWRSDQINGWGKLKLEALIKLNKFTEIASCIGDLKRLAGKSFSGAEFRNFITHINKKFVIPQDWEGLLSSGPREDPPMPTKKLVRSPLMAWTHNNPEWSPVWESIRHSPSMQLFGPDELQWTKPPQQTISILQQKHNWSTEGRWVISYNDEIVRSEISEPTVLAIHNIVDLHVDSIIKNLNNYMRNYTSSRGAARKLSQILFAKMPNPHLENKLLETLLIGPWHIGIKENWSPTGEKWTLGANNALVPVTQHLKIWPKNKTAWSTFIFWNSLRGTKLDLIPIFKESLWWPHLEGGWSAPSLGLLDHIIKELAKRGDWNNIAAVTEYMLEKLDELPKALEPQKNQWTKIALNSRMLALSKLGDTSKLLELKTKWSTYYNHPAATNKRH